MNSALKTSISKKNTIVEFAVRLQLLLNKHREEEKEADFHCFDSKPKLRTNWKIEANMAKIYTRSIFRIFQEEIGEASGFSLHLVNEEEGNKIFRVGPRDINKKKLVSVSGDGNLARCEC